MNLQKPYKKLLINLERSGLYGKLSDLGHALFTSLSLGQYGNVSVWDFPVKIHSRLISNY